jgi:AcrR family transcriptional regulator
MVEFHTLAYAHMPDMRLSRDDWVDAAVKAVLRDGPEAVAVQPLARRLKTTKGSFYWHFSSRQELLRAVLERWETVATDDVIASVEARSGDPRTRAAALIDEVTAHSRRHPGELLLLAAPAQRDTRAAIERVTRRRIDYIAGLLRASGQTPAAAQRRATLGYAACLGHAQLASAVGSVLPQNTRGQRALAAELADILLN